MLTCKEASLLASKKLDKNLTLRERIEFSLHTAMCGLCRYYAKDLQALHRLMQKMAKRDNTGLIESTKLSEQARERIKQTMSKVLHPIDKS